MKVLTRYAVPGSEFGSNPLAGSSAPLVGLVGGADSPNVIGGQLAPSVAFATASSALRRHVPLVVGRGPSKEMIRSATSADIAAVKGKRLRAERPCAPREHESIDSGKTPLEPEVAVAASHDRSGPQPARLGLVDLRPEPTTHTARRVVVEVVMHLNHCMRGRSAALIQSAV